MPWQMSWTCFHRFATSIIISASRLSRYSPISTNKSIWVAKRQNLKLKNYTSKFVSCQKVAWSMCRTTLRTCSCRRVRTVDLLVSFVGSCLQLRDCKNLYRPDNAVLASCSELALGSFFFILDAELEVKGPAFFNMDLWHILTISGMWWAMF